MKKKLLADDEDQKAQQDGRANDPQGGCFREGKSGSITPMPKPHAAHSGSQLTLTFGKNLMNISPRTLWLASLPGSWVNFTMMAMFLIPSLAENQDVRPIGSIILVSFLLIAPIGIITSGISLPIAFFRSFKAHPFIFLAFYHLIILLGSVYGLFVMLNLPHFNMM